MFSHHQVMPVPAAPVKTPLQIAWCKARKCGSVSGFHPLQSVPYSLTKKGLWYFSKNRAVFCGHHLRRMLFVVGMVLGEVHLRQGVEVGPLAAAGEARGDQVPAGIDATADWRPISRCQATTSSCFR